MIEDLSDLFGKGFDTYRNNLSLCIPFILNLIFSVIAMLPILTSFLSLIGLSNWDAKSFDTFYLEMKDHLSLLALGVLLTILILSLISSFFESSAIGMARQALVERKATLEEMWISGKNNFLKMFLLSVITAIIMTIGIIFFLPGLVLVPWSDPSAIMENPTAFGLLFIGFILFIIYLFFISVALALAPSILIVDRKGPLKAINSSWKFFRYNKFDVIVVWLVVIALSIGLQTVGNTLTKTAAFMTFQPLYALTSLINILILAPLSTVWWTRLYMSRTYQLKDEDRLWQNSLS
jgi:hypothetical protein